jgi:hypothetical protein
MTDLATAKHLLDRRKKPYNTGNYCTPPIYFNPKYALSYDALGAEENHIFCQG